MWPFVKNLSGGLGGFYLVNSKWTGAKSDLDNNRIGSFNPLAVQKIISSQITQINPHKSLGEQQHCFQSTRKYFQCSCHKLLCMYIHFSLNICSRKDTESECWGSKPLWQTGGAEWFLNILLNSPVLFWASTRNVALNMPGYTYIRAKTPSSI